MNDERPDASEAPRAWMAAGHRTWRYRLDDDPDHYRAVETTDEGLRYFAWSHLHGEDGLSDERWQPFEAFEAEGPLTSMPSEVEAAIRAWIRARPEG